MDTIIEDIKKEVTRAKEIHPHWPEDILHQMAIVNEEAGEATRAAVQLIYEGGNIPDLKTELIQTCATCIRMLEALNHISE